MTHKYEKPFKQIKAEFFSLLATIMVGSLLAGTSQAASISCGQTVTNTSTSDVQIDQYSYVGSAGQKVSVGFLMAGAACLSHSSEERRNFAEKELPYQTFLPGQSMEGFVYISPVKKGADWSRNNKSIATIKIKTFNTV